MPIMNEFRPSVAVPVYPTPSDNPIIAQKEVGEEQKQQQDAEPKAVVTACMNEFPALSVCSRPAVSLDNSVHNDDDDGNNGTSDDVKPDDDEWENLSSRECNGNEKGTSETEVRPVTAVPINDPRTLHRCTSTPEFSKLRDEDDSYVLDCTTSSVDAFSVASGDAVLLTKRNDNGGIGMGMGKGTGMKKVPSFKDIIMLNAQAREEADRKQKEQLQEHQERLRKEASQRRKKSRPRLVVNPIKRCAKSTGDLRSMVIVEEEDDGHGCYGGGGGVVGGDSIMEEEILGDTDASEFYNRKQKGSTSRQNGKKLRPDEAKRKDFIIHKKEAQRRAQQQRKK